MATTETEELEKLRAHVAVLEAEVIKSRKLLLKWREPFLEFLEVMENRLVELDKLTRGFGAS